MLFWILIGLVVVIGLALGIYWASDYCCGFWRKVFTFIGGFLIGSFISIGAGGVVFAITLSLASHTDDGWSITRSDRTELAALATGSDLSGRFFLGSGYIEQEQTFNYIANDEGTYRLSQVPAADTTVKMDEEESPYLTTYHWDQSFGWLAPVPINSAETYEFHIPEGSILSGYKVAP